MSKILTSIYLSPQTDITLSGYRDRVLSSGTALLACYTINFLFQLLTTLLLKQNRQFPMRKLFETSQILYWFGIASMIVDYFGAFSAVIGYVCVLLVLAMHVFCLVDKKVSGRSLWSVFYFFFHFLVMVWIVVALILAFIWSNAAYNGS